MDAITLRAGLARCCTAMEAAADELNELDGRLGDGDLGATLRKCAENVQAALPGMPERLDEVFKHTAQACAKASGSSFGTLLAVAFLAAGKWSGPREQIDRCALVELLLHTVEVLSARGGAQLGDKTMLDALQAIAVALRDAPAQADSARTARQAAQQAIDDFRGRPNRIGRARMFAEKSMGLDDPGMVAVLRMTESL